jgi:hypothetical protein
MRRVVTAHDLAGNMLTQTLVSTTQVPEPAGHDFADTFPQALENNDNRMTDAAFSYDPNGNLVRFLGQRWFRVGRDSEPVLTLRDGEGQALAERKVGVAPPRLAADSPPMRGTSYRIVVTAGAGTGSYTMDVAARSGDRKRVAGVTLDGQGRGPLAPARTARRSDLPVRSGSTAPSAAPPAPSTPPRSSR